MTNRERAAKWLNDNGVNRDLTRILEAELDAATAQGRREALEEAVKAVCPKCAVGHKPNANLKSGNPAHAIGSKITFCRAAPIRAMYGS